MATNEYSLHLSDGSRWWLTGDELNAPWVDKLATIMELHESASDGSSRLVFCRAGHLNGSVIWKHMRDMKIYRGSRLWEDTGCYTTW